MTYRTAVSGWICLLYQAEVLIYRGMHVHADETAAGRTGWMVWWHFFRHSNPDAQIFVVAVEDYRLYTPP